MSILGLLGSFIGGGKRESRSSERRANSVTQTDRLSRSSGTDATAKAKAATKLTLIKTSSAGVLGEATTGRKKLLGN